MNGAVAVIIVNYGTADLAIEAVESVLARDHGGRPVEVHLVDNASPGEDAARFEETHATRGWGARVALWLENENHGFGRGNNLVLDVLIARDDPPEFVFLLNPDARLENEAISILAETLETTLDVALVGASLIRPNGRRVPAAFRFPGFISELANGASFGPLSRILARRATALSANIAETQKVDWVSGAAFMARLDTLKNVGFFDPGFFLYFEEVELMARVRQAGWSIQTVPDACVVHVAGAATGLAEGRSRKGPLPDYWFESWRLFFTKRYGRLGAIAIASARLCGVGIDWTISKLARRPQRSPEGFSLTFTRQVLKPLLMGDV